MIFLPILLPLILLILWYVCRQSVFRGSSSVRTLRMHLPSFDIDNLVTQMKQNSRQQIGLKVVGIRASEDEICEYEPRLHAFLRSDQFLSSISGHVGFMPARIEMFARLYMSGDYIDWHYDDNLTVARRATCVMQLHETPQNSSHFEYMTSKNEVVRPVTGRGSLLLYDENVFHRVTQQTNGERLSVIIVLYEDERTGWMMSVIQWAKKAARKLNIDF